MPRLLTLQGYTINTALLGADWKNPNDIMVFFLTKMLSKSLLLSYNLYIKIYYMTTGYPSEISPYFIGQIQLDGLKIPYYPSTLCNGKR